MRRGAVRRVPGGRVTRMGFVRNRQGPAWGPHGCVSSRFRWVSLGHRVPSGCAYAPEPKEDLVLDLVYIGLTIVVFAALWLLIRGVERFER